MSNDMVKHPAHYTTGHIEVIDFIEDKDLNFNLGNVVKYVARNGYKKDPTMSDSEKALEDLKKAQQYLTFEIRRRERILSEATPSSCESIPCKEMYD